MTPTYNLLDRPWIACVGLDGAVRSVGLREALLQAHTLRDLADDSPLARAGTLRLLLAIAYRACKLRTRVEWTVLWKRRSFDPAPIEAYLGPMQDRFDLFHPRHPFYQSAGVSAGLLAAAELDAQRTTATNIRLFSHDLDGRTSLDFATCAKGLVALPAFCTQGGSGKAPSLNGKQMSYVFPRGATLFETLMLNLPVAELLPECAALHVKDDAPLWEGGATHDGETIGYLEGLTWRPRNVNLAPPLAANALDLEQVRQIIFAKGNPTPRGREWRDPYVAPSGAPSVEKAGLSYQGLWRLALGDILTAAAGNPEAAPILLQLQRLYAAGTVEDAVSVWHLSYHVRQATSLTAQERVWRLPSEIWTDEDLQRVTQASLSLADELLHAFGRKFKQTVARREAVIAGEALAAAHISEAILRWEEALRTSDNWKKFATDLANALASVAEPFIVLGKTRAVTAERRKLQSELRAIARRHTQAIVKKEEQPV